MIQLEQSCLFDVLVQDGPLSSKVCEVTLQLLDLADRCFGPEGMHRLHRSLGPNRNTGGNIGRKVGSELHKVLYEIAVRDREKGKLEPRLKITRPSDMKAVKRWIRKGENDPAGPDFMLVGTFGGEWVHAAWDFTTTAGMRSHFDRDILGNKDKAKRPMDSEIQEPFDTVRYWTSYIVIHY